MSEPGANNVPQPPPPASLPPPDGQQAQPQEEIEAAPASPSSLSAGDPSVVYDLPKPKRKVVIPPTHRTRVGRLQAREEVIKRQEEMEQMRQQGLDLKEQIATLAVVVQQAMSTVLSPPSLPPHTPSPPSSLRALPQSPSFVSLLC